MTESLIQLSTTLLTVGYRTVVNPSHIEEAYLQECSTSTSSGHYIDVQGKNYWCPTEVAVVVHYASGRTSVYGGNDANTLWIALHNTPAYVDTQDYIVLDNSHGLKVKIRGYHDVSGCAYDWVQAPAQFNHEQLADALLHLLWVHDYISTDDIAGIDEGTHEPVFVMEGVGMLKKGHPFRDAVLLMPCSYRIDN